MINQQLLDYIRQQLAAGMGKDVIKQVAVSAGWPPQDVDEVFKAIETPGVPLPPPVVVVEPKHTASIGRRFWTYVLDTIFVYIFFWIVNFFVAVVEGIVVLGGTTVIPTSVAICSFIFSYAVYYIFFESIWQRTPGKWITKTKVVRLDGTKPGFWRIVGRFLCRYIPFEAFSFLFGRYPYGWHDRISKTMVVPAAYTPAEAASVDPHNKGKSHVGIIIFIIVLVLAIPLIGILSSIVLVSLNDARQKGADAGVQGDMMQLQIQSALYQNQDNNSFQGFCASSQATTPLQDASQLGAQTSSAYVCNDSPTHWAASVPLRSAGYLCADDTTTQPIPVASSLGTQTSCSGGDIINSSSTPQT